MTPSDTVTDATYRARVLPLDEWRARQAELPYPPGALEPGEFKLLVVVEDEAGRIVASWCAMNVLMLEGLHVQTGHRHTMVAKHLLYEMLGTLIDAKVSAALTLVTDPAIARLAEHNGFVEVPGRLYQRALTEESA